MDIDDAYSEVPERATRLYAHPAYVGSASSKSLDISPLSQKIPIVDPISNRSSGYHIDVDFKIGELAVLHLLAVQV